MIALHCGTILKAAGDISPWQVYLNDNVLYKRMCYEYVVAFEAEVIIGCFEVSDNWSNGYLVGNTYSICEHR